MMYPQNTWLPPKNLITWCGTTGASAITSLKQAGPGNVPSSPWETKMADDSMPGKCTNQPVVSWVAVVPWLWENYRLRTASQIPIVAQ